MDLRGAEPGVWANLNSWGERDVLPHSAPVSKGEGMRVQGPLPWLSIANIPRAGSDCGGIAITQQRFLKEERNDENSVTLLLKNFQWEDTKVY